MLQATAREIIQRHTQRIAENESTCDRPPGHSYNCYRCNLARCSRRRATTYGPRTVDCRRTWLRDGPDISADGRRGLHDLLFPGHQRLGLLQGRADAVHPGTDHSGLRGFVLYPAADLASGPQIRPANNVRFLRTPLRERI